MRTHGPTCQDPNEERLHTGISNLGLSASAVGAWTDGRHGELCGNSSAGWTLHPKPWLTLHTKHDRTARSTGPRGRAVSEVGKTRAPQRDLQTSHGESFQLAGDHEARIQKPSKLQLRVELYVIVLKQCCGHRNLRSVSRRSLHTSIVLQKRPKAKSTSPQKCRGQLPLQASSSSTDANPNIWQRAGANTQHQRE